MYIVHTIIYHLRVYCLLFFVSNITLSLEIGITDLVESVTAEKDTLWEEAVEDGGKV